MDDGEFKDDLSGTISNLKNMMKRDLRVAHPSGNPSHPEATLSGPSRQQEDSDGLSSPQASCLPKYVVVHQNDAPSDASKQCGKQAMSFNETQPTSLSSPSKDSQSDKSEKPIIDASDDFQSQVSGSSSQTQTPSHNGDHYLGESEGAGCDSVSLNRPFRISSRTIFLLTNLTVYS
jgi:hypothetical protein